MYFFLVQILMSARKRLDVSVQIVNVPICGVAMPVNVQMTFCIFVSMTPALVSLLFHYRYPCIRLRLKANMVFTSFCSASIWEVSSPGLNDIINIHVPLTGKESQQSKVGWAVSLIILAGMAVLGVGAYIVYKYRLRVCTIGITLFLLAEFTLFTQATLLSSLNLLIHKFYAKSGDFILFEYRHNAKAYECLTYFTCMSLLVYCI
jgi:hypothetical protein